MTDQQPMTIVDHLEELRRRILVVLALFVPLAIVGFFMSSPILSLLSPMTGPLVFFAPTDALAIRVKIAMVFATLLSVPVISYELWMFIAPAFSPSAKRGVAFGIISSVVLFWVGVAVGYAIMPAAMTVLLSFGGPGLQPVLNAQETLNFIFIMMMLFGLSFEFPLVLMILLALRIITAEGLRKFRSYAILLIVIVSAIITPTQDVFTLALMSVPLILFYEVVILLAPWVQRR